MKLTYIYHSGYAIEGNGFTVIIDYYKDSLSDSEGVVHDRLLKNDGKLYVLCTHSHHDHFVLQIMEWRKYRQDITYIFSKELLESGKVAAGDAIFLDKLETYKDDTLNVKAFGSTDLGGSFLIKAEDKVIFHAGDLNNWHWNEESTDEEVKEAENYYNEELSILAKHIGHIHLAMFPVDPRLGKDYMKGAEQFINTIKTDIFVPMHFGMEYEKAAAFAPYASTKNCRCICWTHRGEETDI